MSNDTMLTSDGKKQLEERLEKLKVFSRKDVAEKIKIAREFGDISENAEYDAAKEEQAMIEGEIIEIEAKLRSAVIIEDKVETSSVNVGNTVKIFDMEFNEEAEYKIVGTAEADAKANRISNESPVGKALLGKKKNDVVEVNAPQGKFKIKILKIS